MLEERQPEFPSRSAPESEAVLVLRWKISCVTHLFSREDKLHFFVWQQHWSFRKFPPHRDKAALSG